jgi:peptidoglycan/xylan/chitin deacetylase (PgdA/CDA1 family)
MAAWQSLSRLARDVVHQNGVTRVLCRLQSRPRILMLHGVGGLDLPADALRAQLAFLARHFRLVPLDQICRRDGHRDPRPKVALTFDDGLRNNLTLAYPLLKEFRVPATFFVCPGLIEAGRWLWNHECRARLAWMQKEDRECFARALCLVSADPHAIVERLKYRPNAERRAFEENIRNATAGFQPTCEQHERWDVMNWEELRSLDPELISIGGHSVHHEILPRLDAAHLEREVAECRSWLERELGRPVRQFCYPDGACDAAVRECVGRHFECAVTTRHGWVPEQPSPLDLPRIPIPATVSDLAWRMQRPTG